MSVHIILRKEVLQDEWDDLVKSSPDGWAFSLWGWQELILAVDKWGLEEYSFALREGKRLLAVVPLQYHPGSNRMASSGWGGCGPVIDGQLNKKARDKLMRQAIQHCINLTKEKKADGFDISSSPVTATSLSNIWGVNPLAFYGLDDKSGLSQVIDLSLSENDLWAGLSADARSQIKKARNAGFTVKSVNWAEHLDNYYSMHVDNYTRTGVAPHPREYFAGIARHMAATHNSVLWAAMGQDGKVYAYHNAAWFGLGAYYHTGCSVSENKESGVSYLLFWQAMLGAKKAGIDWYDCGAIFPNASASEKQKGLSLFKTKFGGQPHRLFAGHFAIKNAISPATLAYSPPLWRKVVNRGLNIARQLLR